MRWSKCIITICVFEPDEKNNVYPCKTNFFLYQMGFPEYSIYTDLRLSWCCWHFLQESSSSAGCLICRGYNLNLVFAFSPLKKTKTIRGCDSKAIAANLICPFAQKCPTLHPSAKNPSWSTVNFCPLNTGTQIAKFDCLSGDRIEFVCMPTWVELFNKMAISEDCLDFGVYFKHTCVKI